MTTRDKWLASILPALVTLLIGWIFFLRPSGRELTNLRQRVENQGPLIARQALVTRAQVDLADLEAAIAARRSVAPTEDGVFDRNAAMQQVSVLAAASELSLNAAALEPGGRLPPALQEATAALAQHATPPQVWRIELTGNYPGVVKLLGGLQKAKPLIVPLSLSMEADKNERKPAKWVLTLWL